MAAGKTEQRPWGRAMEGRGPSVGLLRQRGSSVQGICVPAPGALSSLPASTPLLEPQAQWHLDAPGSTPLSCVLSTTHPLKLPSARSQARGAGQAPGPTCRREG